MMPGFFLAPRYLSPLKLVLYHARTQPLCCIMARENIGNI